MKKTFEHTLAALKNEPGLSDVEREKMRTLLHEYMAFKPLPAFPTTARRGFTLSSFLRSHRPLALLTACALLFVTLSGGVAYAAENTLPGDTLYSVKIAVTEPVRTLLASSPKAKVSWHIELADRRLDEAAALAQKEELSTSTARALTEAFSLHAEFATEAIAAQEKEDPVGATASAARFSGQLHAHIAILDEIEKGTKQPSATLITSSIKTLLAARGTAAHVAKEEAPSAVATVNIHRDSNTKASADAFALGTAATEALKNSADTITSASSTLGASTSEQARSELAKAFSATKKGRELLTAGDDSGATEAFRSALSATAQIDTLTHAATTFQINAFSGKTKATTSIEIDAQKHDENAPQQIMHLFR